MKAWRVLVCLTLLAGLVGVQNVAVASQPTVAVGQDEVAGGRKSVTVFARNAATASAKAQSQNPGWTVVSVTKVSKDPKSMAYRVVLKK